MKTFTLGLEFTNGNFDLRTVRAENIEDAKAKVISRNNTRLSNKAMFPSAKEISSIEAQ